MRQSPGMIMILEADLSKAKGSKEKNKMKKQADEKKRVAANQKISKTSQSHTALGGSGKKS